MSILKIREENGICRDMVKKFAGSKKYIILEMRRDGALKWTAL